MAISVTPFFMFNGQAEEALTFYMSLFKRSRLEAIAHYGEDGLGDPGTVISATFDIDGQRMTFIDSAINHDFDFTPSTSMYVNCDSEEEVERLHTALSVGGKDLMPLGEYPFSQKYCWIVDRFGLSWQLGFETKVEALKPSNS